MEKALIKVPEDTQKAALYYHDKVFALMQEMRAITDEMETMTASEYGPYPTYGEMLFNILIILFSLFLFEYTRSALQITPGTMTGVLLSTEGCTLSFF